MCLFSSLRVLLFPYVLFLRNKFDDKSLGAQRKWVLLGWLLFAAAAACTEKNNKLTRFLAEEKTKLVYFLSLLFYVR